jgi:uncharacterized FAD-dependent dehydrogenase
VRRRFDEELVVVGAGPAGLAAAAAARRLGTTALLIESGAALADRDQEDPRTIVEGVGGAGLFSDGKFSFWPSATQLWNLDPALLMPAWREISVLLRGCGIAIDDLEDHSAGLPVAPAADATGYALKEYPSVYGTPETRREIVSVLQDHAPTRRVGVNVTGLTRHDAGWLLGTTRGTVTARRVVLATGRFGTGPLTVLRDEANSEIALVPRRLEVGVRIQQPAPDFFLRDLPLLDPKLLWDQSDNGFQWRTFCCCRDGLVQPTLARGLWTVSGRADCPPTGRSNIGFNLRTVDPAAIDREWPGLNSRLQVLRSTVTVGFEEFVTGGGDELRHALGDWLASGLVKGLQRLQTSFPDAALGAAELIGPTLEGVGRYPAHDHQLRAAEGLWVAGDLTGSFRGLTAALISGHIAGTASVADAAGSAA